MLKKVEPCELSYEQEVEPAYHPSGRRKTFPEQTTRSWKDSPGEAEATYSLHTSIKRQEGNGWQIACTNAGCISVCRVPLVRDPRYTEVDTGSILGMGSLIPGSELPHAYGWKCIMHLSTETSICFRVQLSNVPCGKQNLVTNPFDPTRVEATDRGKVPFP